VTTRAAVLLLLGAAMSMQSCRAQSAADPPATTAPEPKPEVEVIGALEACTRTEDVDRILERVRRGLAISVCASSAWLDGLFGERMHVDEYKAAHGVVSAGALWSDYDGFDSNVRFRVRLQLPNLDERISLFAGRLGEDEHIADTSEADFYAPPAGRYDEPEDDFDALPTRRFGEVEDESVLVGLGYSSPVRARDGFDVGVGVRVRWPLDPYARARYQIVRTFAGNYVFAGRQAAFWRHSDGFGTTTHATIDRALSDRFLLRWSNLGTFSENTQGVEWYTQLTLFQSLDARTGLAWQAQTEGATDAEVPLGRHSVRLIMRRQLTSDWLFIELRTGVSWPRERVDETRDPSLEIGAAIEMSFGNERERR